MTTSHRRALRIAAATATLALLAAACSSSSSKSTGGSVSPTSAASGPNKASAPGVSATEVKIGSHQPLTGPAAPGYSEIAPAANAYFQWVNNHGGVFGRKITYTYLDDGYNPANTTSVVRQLVLQNGVFAIFQGLGTPTHLAVRDFLNSDKVPDLFVASGCTCWNAPSQAPETFGWQTDYVVEGELQGQYIKQNYAGKKVGYFSQNDDFGQDGVKGLDKQISSSSVVSRQTYVPSAAGVAGVGPAMSALQAAGAQVVVSYSIPAFTALALGAAAKIGYHPTWVVSNVGSDIVTLKGLLGATGSPLIEGIVTDTYLNNVYDPSNPWTQLFKQIHDQYDAAAPFDGNVNYGMASAYTFVQALLAAGQNPTRDSIVKAVESSHFTGPGLVPFTFSSANHQGFSGVQIGTIKNGALVVSGTPETATDTGNIQPYTTAQGPPPTNGIPGS
ncbi:MAG TPA: ABC transporter substrate-binding protein [Acidimicrobiales bacterium]|jgi:ABC-type branched-subunit amino acid transport system substrate-binding protein|nr:ABC transporter substrate-binding protein [Acidimicrobiales bacterium]